MPPDPLPGMPITIGDPGVFLCGPVGGSGRPDGVETLSRPCRYPECECDRDTPCGVTTLTFTARTSSTTGPMPPDPLPGMPITIGDPGVFLCGPADIAPGESAPVRGRPATPARTRAPLRGHVAAWLVLALCPHCNVATGRYCTNHDARNWWLTHWGR